MAGLAEDIMTALLFQVSGGALLGFASGYAAKKLLKLALLVLGVMTGGLLLLEYKGIINVNYDALVASVEEAMGVVEATGESLKAHIIANVPFASSFLAAFALGFKYG
ncbi:MAG: hypothetical protein GSR84_02915 [Desulfurococcales archaeon]|nr:hypothetical protein [Desulfurococcales archaeon]